MCRRRRLGKVRNARLGVCFTPMGGRTHAYEARSEWRFLVLENLEQKFFNKTTLQTMKENLENRSIVLHRPRIRHNPKMSQSCE